MSHNSKLMYRNRVVNHHRNHSNNCSKPRIISIVNWMDFWIWKHHWLGMYYFHNTYLNSFSLVLHRVSQMMTDEWGEKNQHMWHMFVRAFISHARNLEWRVAKYSVRFFRFQLLILNAYNTLSSVGKSLTVETSYKLYLKRYVKRKRLTCGHRRHTFTSFTHSHASPFLSCANSHKKCTCARSHALYHLTLSHTHTCQRDRMNSISFSIPPPRHRSSNKPSPSINTISIIKDEIALEKLAVTKQKKKNKKSCDFFFAVCFHSSQFILVAAL